MSKLSYLEIPLMSYEDYKLDTWNNLVYLGCFKSRKDIYTVSDDAYMDAISCGKKLYELLSDYSKPFKKVKDTRSVRMITDKGKYINLHTMIIDKLPLNKAILGILKKWMNKYGTPWARDNLHNFNYEPYIVRIEGSHQEANIIIFKFVDLLIFSYIVFESVISKDYSKLFDIEDFNEETKREHLLKLFNNIEEKGVIYNDTILYEKSHRLIKNKMATKLNLNNKNNLELSFIFEDIYSFLWYNLKSSVASHLDRENLVTDSNFQPYYKICDLCKELYNTYNNRQKNCNNCIEYGEVSNNKSKRSYKKRIGLRDELKELFTNNTIKVSKVDSDRIATIISLPARELKKVSMFELTKLLSIIKER